MTALLQPLFNLRSVVDHTVNIVDSFVGECFKNVKCFIWVNFMTFTVALF